jgi:hypothetical protein
MHGDSRWLQATPTQSWDLAETKGLVKPCTYIEMHWDLVICVPLFVCVLLAIWLKICCVRRGLHSQAMTIASVGSLGCVRVAGEASDEGGCDVYYRRFPWNFTDFYLMVILGTCGGILFFYTLLLTVPALVTPDECKYHEPTGAFANVASGCSYISCDCPQGNRLSDSTRSVTRVASVPISLGPHT